MTELELNAIRARLDAATPGPWFTGMSGGHWYVLDNDITCDIEGQICSLNRRHAEANADLIANAPSDLAALLAEVDILSGLLSDRVQDSDLAVEAARRERARCVAMADERRGQEEEWAKLAEPGPARQFHVARSLALGGLAEKLKGNAP